MLASATALGCALLLGQVGDAAEGLREQLEEEVSEARQGTEPSAEALGVVEPPAAVLPLQPWNGPKVCLRLAPTKAVPSGRYHAQCDDTKRECLVAPANELDWEGVETDRLLERAQPCAEEFSPDRHRGYRMVPSIAEAPPGWYRDERGRVMQFNFDLHRRVWLGAAWAPRWLQGEADRDDRVRVDFGVSTEWSGKGRLLHRLTLLDTELYLGDASTLDATLLRYDFSVERDEPLFRVTTFLGTPRRHDFYANLGLWMELLHFEEVRRADAEADFLTFGAMHATLDLWHSRDLVSYVRLRAGPALERDRTNGFLTLVPGAALEGDLTLDRDGFQHVRFGMEAQKVLLAEEVEGRSLQPQRLRLHVGYEVILLAVNDQPLSAVLDWRGTWRDDVANAPAAWEWSGQAGLRFSLWAPARRSAPLTPGKG